MTSKEYKRMCRIRVTRYSKLITYLSLTFIYINCYVSAIFISDYKELIITQLVTTVWLYMPDLAAYGLECLHKLHHDFISYR